ncbi:coiled-coil domain-containing protein [Helicobacter pylori]|uniref:coiled-coil domain-containing protein n=1 Tax=Helicobacter pylori TaxID=210 RepID=UPI0015E64EB0|nr:apolipoprotein A1/A4/E family protein [Helicobacter pylori]
MDLKSLENALNNGNFKGFDLRNLENALNNGDFKEQVCSSLEGIYEISKVLNQLDLLKNFSDHDLRIVANIQAIKTALAGYETSEQELKAKINALVNSLEATKQELEARLNTQLQIVRNNETQKLNEAGNELKNNLVAELAKVKDNLALELEKLKASAQSLLNTPRMQGVNLKFLGVFIYGRQSFFKNESDQFRELFEFNNIRLIANKSYIVQFSMPYELSTNGIYSESMGEMVLCLKANSKVYPIINSFYQNKTTNLTASNKIVDTYRVNSIFLTPSDEADYKIALFARKHKDLWLNVNYTSNMQGFETSFLNSARFANLTTQSIPKDYNNDWVFYKNAQALVYPTSAKNSVL